MKKFLFVDPHVLWPWESRFFLAGRTSQLLRRGRKIADERGRWAFRAPPFTKVTVFGTPKAAKDMDGLPFLEGEDRFGDFLGHAPLFTEGEEHVASKEILVEYARRMRAEQPHFEARMIGLLKADNLRGMDLGRFLQTQLVKYVVVAVTPPHASAEERRHVEILVEQWLDLANSPAFFLYQFRKLKSWEEMKKAREELERLLGQGNQQRASAAILMILAATDNLAALTLDVLLRAGGRCDGDHLETLINESLAEFTPAPLNLRLVNRDGVIIDGCPVKKGSAVALDNALAGTQWGHGTHACVGKHHALAFIRFFMKNFPRELKPRMNGKRKGVRLTSEVPTVIAESR